MNKLLAYQPKNFYTKPSKALMEEVGKPEFILHMINNKLMVVDGYAQGYGDREQALEAIADIKRACEIFREGN